MKPFQVTSLHEGSNSITSLNKLRDRLDTSPAYQRQADVWKPPKQQLFVDSLINGFDIPKLYFHDVSAIPKNKGAKYAVVDGKQRLQAIWSFLDDELPLSEDFEFFEDDKLEGANKKYSELPPRLRARFDGYHLPIQIIDTDDVQWVEELFCRMNEAVALNAPERRNALGGPVPALIRELAGHAFFKKNVPFKNNRYKHYDLAVKFMFLEQQNGPTPTKRVALDNFVRYFKDKDDASTPKQLKGAVEKVLERLTRVFGESDDLLTSIGLVVIYYLLERSKKLSGGTDTKATLVEFEGLRSQVRTIMRSRGEDGVEDLDQELVEFERLSQSLNDVAAMKFRMGTIDKFLADPKLIKTKLKELKKS